MHQTCTSLGKCQVLKGDRGLISAQVMSYNSYRAGMDVTVKHLVPDKLPQFVLQKASDAQQAAKAITKAAEVLIIPAVHGCASLPSLSQSRLHVGSLSTPAVCDCRHTGACFFWQWLTLHRLWPPSGREPLLMHTFALVRVYKCIALPVDLLPVRSACTGL